MGQKLGVRLVMKSQGFGMEFPIELVVESTQWLSALRF